MFLPYIFWGFFLEFSIFILFLFVNRYECQCIPGVMGTNCEIDVKECDSNPCKNGATCKEEIGKYSCECGSGYEGTHCEIEINECDRYKWVVFRFKCCADVCVVQSFYTVTRVSFLQTVSTRDVQGAETRVLRMRMLLGLRRKKLFRSADWVHGATNLFEQWHLYSVRRQRKRTQIQLYMPQWLPRSYLRMGSCAFCRLLFNYFRRFLSSTWFFLGNHDVT